MNLANLLRKKKRTKRFEQLIYPMDKSVRGKTKHKDSLLGNCQAKIMCNGCGVARKFVQFKAKGKDVSQETRFCSRGRGVTERRELHTWIREVCNYLDEPLGISANRDRRPSTTMLGTASNLS